MQTETVTLRPLGPADAPALAELVLQLYNAEMPGILQRPRADQLRVFRLMAEHELAGGGRGRYLALDGTGAVVGSASLRRWTDEVASTPPPGMLRAALAALGPADTLRMLGSMLRASLFTETTLRRNECYIYSVVVAEGRRGCGVGRSMMGQIEAIARASGVHTALLRVIVGNQRARSLYIGLGYHSIGRTPRWADGLTFPTELMRKDLTV